MRVLAITRQGLQGKARTEAQRSEAEGGLVPESPKKRPNKNHWLCCAYGCERAIALGATTPPPQVQVTKRPTNYPLINVYKRLVINVHVYKSVEILCLPRSLPFPNLNTGGDSCFPSFFCNLLFVSNAWSTMRMRRYFVEQYLNTALWWCSQQNYFLRANLFYCCANQIRRLLIFFNKAW